MAWNQVRGYATMTAEAFMGVAPGRQASRRRGIINVNSMETPGSQPRDQTFAALCLKGVEDWANFTKHSEGSLKFGVYDEHTPLRGT